MKNWKKIAVAVMVLAMSFTFVACGEKGGDGGDAATTDEYVLKVHMSGGQTDPIYTACEQFAKNVEERTGGKVKFELYASSSLGVTADCLEGLSTRTCDIVYDSVSNLSSWTEYANIEALPYMYSSVDHFNAVWNGEVGKEILDKIGSEANVVIFGPGLQGVRVMTTNKPVKSLDDVKGLKLRVPTIDVYLKTWDYVGAACTPLSAAEIFTSLQQGTVDGQENAYPQCVSLSLNEVCKYVTETNHVYSMCPFIMDKTFFESLPKEYQDIMIEEGAKSGETLTKLTTEGAAAAKQKFVDGGAEIFEIDLKEWQAAYKDFVKDTYPNLVEYYEKILAADPAA